MKTLLLIRHAKSDWTDSSLDDFDRPLNDRGKQDAPKMAHRLIDKKIAIDAFISSSAKRAKKTASIFAEVYNKKKEDLILKDELYAAPSSIFYEVIANTSNKLDNLAIFSHNPGLTDFANDLTLTKIDNIPTCGIFAVKINCSSWEDFAHARKEFWFFDYPKAAV